VKPFLFICLAILAIHALVNPHNRHYMYFIGLEGFDYGLKVALRLLCIVIAANFLLLTTEITALIRWFGRINPDLGTILGLALSVVPVMQRQMATTLEVQSARGLRRDSMRERFLAFVAVIVPVIVKSIIRAHGMAQLLYLRGYDARRRPDKLIKLRQDWCFLGFGFCYFLTNLYASRTI
jgi:energy-coupling factor transporter transmembrane protein EcfT